MITVGEPTSGQAVLDCVQKEAEEALKSKHVSKQRFSKFSASVLASLPSNKGAGMWECRSLFHPVSESIPDGQCVNPPIPVTGGFYMIPTSVRFAQMACLSQIQLGTPYRFWIPGRV